MKKIALIFCRYNSKRFSGKILKKFKEKNIIDIIFENLKKSNQIDMIMVATTTNPEDKKIYNYCKKKNYPCYRGSELNLFKRAYDATKKYNPKLLIRITGDNPFTSSEILDFLVKKHIKSKADFTCANKKELPVGVCPEIISFQAIKKILKKKINFIYTEHMRYYFTNNTKIFEIKKINPLKKFKTKIKNLRLTIDYKKDFHFIKKILNLLEKHSLEAKLNNIYKILYQYPKLRNVRVKSPNEHIQDIKLIEKIKIFSTIK